MRKIHQYWKMIVLGFLMLVHALVGNAARLILFGKRRREYQIETVRRHARVMLAVLGVEVEVEGDHNWRPGQTYLCVSNHLSYIDMLVFAAYRPFCFVSTIEVKSTPGLGQIAVASGCLFVERRSRENIRAEIAAIEATLREGFNLVFFPEGTSTNGSTVLPFKRPLFAPAQAAEIPVLPVVVQPVEIDGQKASSANRDFYCYYGDMEFGAHLFALCGCSGVKIKLKILPEIPVTKDTPRDEIATRAQIQISENFQPIT